MAMRDLVTGSTSCPDPSSSSSASNPLGGLATALLGTSSKTQERLKEIPATTPTNSGLQFYSEARQNLNELPGLESDKPFADGSSQGSQFFHSFRSADRAGFEDTWNEIQHLHGPPAQGRVGQFPISEQDIFNDKVDYVPRLLDGTPQRVLSSFLHSFLDSGRGGIPFHPSPLPLLGLSEGDKQCIRDRSSIMARHLFADKSEEFINAQLNALLCSLDIETNTHDKGHGPGRFRELEDYWNESQGNLQPAAHVADGWINEFHQQREIHANPDAWARSFEQQHGVNGWVSEFEQSQLSSAGQMGGANFPNLAAMEQTRLLASTLAQNNDPKFQNSKFLQFVSKMSRGELIIDENQVKETALPASGDWAAEYQQRFDNQHTWADEFLNNKVSNVPEQWADEFTTNEKHISTDDQWVNEFSKLHVNDWAEEFGAQVAKGVFGENSADEWAQAYDEYINEQVAVRQRPDNSRGVYVFSDLNPYVGHPSPFKEGQDLFRKGLLSEAVLALEAEVLKNSENVQAWRLLGVAHAENDDDQQAIAAMMRAQEADPTNLEVLLALGVSHTNELEQAEALKFLYGWLCNHPKYRTLAPPEHPDSLFYNDVARLFNEAAVIAPDDADIHIVLGVLYNLTRDYDKAIQSFQRALKLKPQDYSLWNKLGATQANSVQSADAIMAYQQDTKFSPIKTQYPIVDRLVAFRSTMIRITKAFNIYLTMIRV
ncbi:peroxisome biogenesis protein 5-like isoform X1 [Neltuma alba]|uniref:peroxisome biogenesis protein 5-like isoform X1 n=1 Tax=Neltuma alba TaxID=207710 RepID=UPI0010A5439E|nr:peroxisome biogenesis protein 5-like isoform X1 [Prosopis alba]